MSLHYCPPTLFRVCFHRFLHFGKYCICHYGFQLRGYSWINKLASSLYSAALSHTSQANSSTRSLAADTHCFPFCYHMGACHQCPQVGKVWAPKKNVSTENASSPLWALQVSQTTPRRFRQNAIKQTLLADDGDNADIMAPSSMFAALRTYI